MANSELTFFFDEEKQKVVEPKPVGEFFTALQNIGLIHDAPLPFFDEAKKAEAEVAAGKGTLGTQIRGQMKKMATGVLEIEYGTYDNDYSIHITPVHEKKNLRNDAHVEEALKAAILAIVPHVPQSVHVDIFPPRPDWKMKVISFVLRDGINAWNLDIKQLEEVAIPAMFKAVQEVILK